ncbi:MAG UNVERIFIED_CONTAM: hypothetical protein LVR18_05220 [Planctomycetaceae bacterium]
MDSLLEQLGMRGEERAELLDPAALIQVANGLCEVIAQSGSGADSLESPSAEADEESNDESGEEGE